MPELPIPRSSLTTIECRIHAALLDERAKEHAERSQREPALYLSGIGDCQRNLWAALHGIALEREISAEALAIFDLGDAIEAHVIDLLRRAGYLVADYDESGKQFPVTAFEGRVRGRLDGKIVIGRRNDREAILEIKSAKAERFEALLEVGYAEWSPRYADTLCAYMGWSGIPEAVVVVYCKNDSRIYAEKIHFDRIRFETLKAKAERILDSESILDRPPGATSQYCKFCKWCDRSEWCWSSTTGVQFDD